MKETEPVIHSDPEIMGGTPVFVGTRVPLATLLDYLEAGQPLSEFLEDFLTVTKEHAVAALEQAKEASSPVRVLRDECLPRRLKPSSLGTKSEPLQRWGGPARRMDSCWLWRKATSTFS